MGFSLADARALQALSENSDAPCGDVKEIAEGHLAEVGQKIRALRGGRGFALEDFDAGQAEHCDHPAQKRDLVRASINEYHVGTRREKLPDHPGESGAGTDVNHAFHRAALGDHRFPQPRALVDEPVEYGKGVAA